MTAAVPSPSLCPCGSSQAYADCCGPRIDGSAPAPTALALMRSRYTAFTLGNSAYLTSTHTPAPGDADPNELGRWAKSVHWLSLQILEAPADRGDEGEVKFACSYLERGVKVTLTEKSRFARVDGRWQYGDGTPPSGASEGRSQRPVPLWQRAQVQALPRLNLVGSRQAGIAATTAVALCQPSSLPRNLAISP